MVRVSLQHYTVINNSLLVMTTEREMETTLIGRQEREKKNLHFSKNLLINKSLHDRFLSFHEKAFSACFQLHNFSVFYPLRSRIIIHCHLTSIGWMRDLVLGRLMFRTNFSTVGHIIFHNLPFSFNVKENRLLIYFYSDPFYI